MTTAGEADLPAGAREDPRRVSGEDSPIRAPDAGAAAPAPSPATAQFLLLVGAFVWAGAMVAAFWGWYGYAAHPSTFTTAAFRRWQLSEVWAWFAGGIGALVAGAGWSLRQWNERATKPPGAAGERGTIVLAIVLVELGAVVWAAGSFFLGAVDAIEYEHWPFSIPYWSLQVTELTGALGLALAALGVVLSWGVSRR
ncbi:MAG TPA: hypothetical protein VMH49_06405 [Thermoplasmata archaeon]|nr:hypothetical protein [Thermoplasmata archaeon]